MKLHRSWVAFGVVLAPLAAMALITACGNTADDSSTDSGADGTVEAAKDVAPDNAATDANDSGCANDVDLTQYLPSADAAIDVDAGGYNIAACTGCLKTDCTSQINACNQDCACRETIVDLVQCVAQGTLGFEACGASAFENGDNTAQTLLTCALGSCEAICIGGDAGSKDAAINDAADGG